jgi:arabinoxylan arabinofuranohydrolase
LRPEYATRTYTVGIEASDDGRAWHTVVPTAARSGSPIALPHALRTRYLRLTTGSGKDGYWEWTIE